MEHMTLSAVNPRAGFIAARRQAVVRAGEVLARPVIVAWKDDRARCFAPEIPGGSEDQWHVYGESYGGRLELTVGDDFHFIFIDASDFEEPDLNITRIPDAGGMTIFCINEACTGQNSEQTGDFADGDIGA